MDNYKILGPNDQDFTHIAEALKFHASIMFPYSDDQVTCHEFFIGKIETQLETITHQANAILREELGRTPLAYGQFYSEKEFGNFGKGRMNNNGHTARLVDVRKIEGKE